MALKKKAQGLSINFIIIAALGLVVLVVLILIFRGESTKFIKSMNCPARDGVCLADRGGETCPEGKSVKIYTNDCPEVELKEGMYVAKEGGKTPGQCCIPLG